MSQADTTVQDDSIDPVTQAITQAVENAIADGTIDSADDAFVILTETGHITVMPKSEAGEVVEDQADDEEPLPPFELPAAYQDSNRDSLADDQHYQDHLTSHWGF